MTTTTEQVHLARLELEYRRAEQSLSHFVRAAWPHFEPGTTYIHNWSIDSICANLEALTRRDITRLIINIPPGCMKSSIVSVCWPVWMWIQDPTERILSGSHNMDGPGKRDTLKARRLMRSDWFQARWGDRFRFAGDQDQKTRYENNKTGYRIAFSSKSGVTGERCSVMIFDDPHDATKGMFSAADRETVLNTYDQGLSTRLNDNGIVAIIMQRLHQKDLCGHVMEGEHWEHLCFPMEFEPSRRCETVLGVQDPRTKPGELLWPARFPQEKLDVIKRRLGTYGVAGQLQQSPAPMGGGIVNIDWFNYFFAAPDATHNRETAQFWDTAQKANELLNAPWVGGTWSRTDSGLYLRDVYREWMDYPTGKRAVVSLAEKYNPSAVVIEDKSTGSSLIQELRRETTLPIIAFEPEGDKITRLATESPSIEAGSVYLKEGAPWLAVFLAELAAFPNSDTMDQADMLSMALKWFRTRGGQGGIRYL